MAQYINKDVVIAEIERLIDSHKPLKTLDPTYCEGLNDSLDNILSFIDTLEVKEVDLIDRKTDWCPSKKQMESLKDLLHYNIGVFDYQKFMEVNSLYEDLIKLLDYETDRQK